MKKFRDIHYAYKVMIACVLIKLGTGGMTGLAMGNFVTPIVQELGCQVSELTAYTNFNAISMALLYTTAAKWLNTRHIGKIMGVASIVEVIGLALMATYRTPQMFYISGVLIGVGNSFTGFVALPMVINMWFKKNNGTVLGTVSAVSTAVTMAYSLLVARMITGVGWRTTYILMAVYAAVVTIPAVFLLIKTPEEAGCLAYGADEVQPGAAVASKEEFGLTGKQAFAMPLIYIAWIACVLYSYASGVSGYVTPFITMELGHPITFGAAVGVAGGLGGTLGSLTVGKINDKYGVKAGLLWGTVTTALGFSLMFLTYNSTMLLFPAVFILNLGSSMYMVQCPLMARHIVGSKHYSEIWSRMMMINSLVGGGLYSSIGLFYDKLGSYKGAFIMAICLFALANVLCVISINKSDRLRSVKEPAEV